MVSLHHLTHAVCLVIISFLLKKYIELRNAHGHLTLELQQLRLACPNMESPGSAHHPQPQLCPCSSSQSSRVPPPLQSPSDSKMSPTDMKNLFQTFSKHESSPSSGSQGHAAVTGSSDDDPMDEFGRTSGGSERTGVEIEGSTDFQSLSLTQLPMHPSISSSQEERRGWELDSGRQQVAGRTETAHAGSVSFQSTSESLEKVRPSPSSAVSSDGTVQSSAGRVREEEMEDDDNDFYQGSRGIRHNQRDVDLDVIVTSVSDGVGKDFSPHGVDLSFQTVDDYGDGEWEEEDGEWEEEEAGEEEPHPAFGNVKLEWLSQEDRRVMSEEGSSVQCAGHSLSDRTCRFRHLCFRPGTQQFLFFLSPNSVEDNVPPQASSQQPLLEMSAVAGHNAQYFTYLTQPAASLQDFDVALVSGPTVVFKRFKPDNIMHVFHDDIFPLFHTLVSLNVKPDAHSKKFPVSLFLADENSEGEFYDLYDVFAANGTFTSASLIASVSKASKPNSVVCFSEARVGLAKTTTWYQYGFFTPQGPIPDSQVQSHHVHSTTSFLLDHFAHECELCGEGGHLVLISRKETRRILNEMELVMAISKQFRVKVMTVSLETHDLADILPIIHSSLGIVGMHGSLLALAAFLKQGSVMVELFPYAVGPGHYAPYATLSGIPGMLIAYRAWANQEPDRSVPHPDWSPEFGGIQHLSPQQQWEIVSQTQVPPHLCCEDPSWLYHIFQDTHVDVSQVLSLLSSALQESGPLRAIAYAHPPLLRPRSSSQQPPPGPPRNLRCQVTRSPGLTPTLVVEWTRSWDWPWWAGGGRKGYSVTLQEVESGRGRKVMEVVEEGERVRVRVQEGVMEGADYRVWVRAGGVVEEEGGVYGRFAAVARCSTK